MSPAQSVGLPLHCRPVPEHWVPSMTSLGSGQVGGAEASLDGQGATGGCGHSQAAFSQVQETVVVPPQSGTVALHCIPVGTLHVTPPLTVSGEGQGTGAHGGATGLGQFHAPPTHRQAIVVPVRPLQPGFDMLEEHDMNGTLQAPPAVT